jgi:hypothetical protein
MFTTEWPQRGAPRPPEFPVLPFPIPARPTPTSPQIHAPEPMPPPPPDAERTLDAPGVTTDLA